MYSLGKHQYFPATLPSYHNSSMTEVWACTVQIFLFTFIQLEFFKTLMSERESLSYIVTGIWSLAVTAYAGCNDCLRISRAELLLLESFSIGNSSVKAGQ